MRTYVLCAFAAVSLSAVSSRGEVLIAENGAARAVIVVADDATVAEKHAAAELASILKEVTGGTFEVVAKAEGGRPRLLVGAGAAKVVEGGSSVEGLGQEGLVIRTVGSDLILAGGRPRGTLYAVYTFLEDHVGCRWWSSKVSTIPKKATLKIGELNVRFIPRLEYRESFWFDGFDGDWAVRNKSNGNSERLDAKRGGKHSYQGFVHTFYPLIPPEKYFKDHPEWYSEIGGKRQYDHKQLCLTNEEMRQELVKNLKAQLRANPAATIASVSQNDWHGNCQCAKCAAIDKEEGSPAGSLLRFVNKVAEDIEKEFPQVAISTLAYQYTRKPPKLVKPRPNVIVRLCSIECSFSKPLADERNKAFRDDIVGWSKICNRLYIWDYTTNFAHYVLPHPNLRVLAPNIRFFVEHGVKGIFEQGAYQSYGSEMAELKAWVLAKLLWDPSLDAAKLIVAFTDGYYGPAGKQVRAYLELMHNAVDKSGDHLGCFSAPTAGFLSFRTLRDGLKILKEAEAAAGGDAALRHRVQVAQLPVLYAFMVQWDALRAEAEDLGEAWPVADEMQPVYDEFMRVAKAANMTMVSEGRGIDWLKTVLDRPRRKRCGPPPGCESLSKDRWVDLQDSGFRLAREDWAKLAEDAKASDGAAARMPTTHHEWAVSRPLGKLKPISDADEKGVRVKLSIRVEATGKEGGAFTCGIWDMKNRRSVANLGVQASQIVDDAYHTYDLGVCKLTPEMYIWVAPVVNKENVQAIWVDRMWLVRE
ncbi:MAG: DUF4838 domain-containing protein [Phycisphaerae bacterium]|nr:DUF4838 domain-containing protein [Phycisphaerae bacterium]